MYRQYSPFQMRGGQEPICRQGRRPRSTWVLPNGASVPCRARIPRIPAAMPIADSFPLLLSRPPPSLSVQSETHDPEAPPDPKKTPTHANDNNNVNMVAIGYLRRGIVNGSSVFDRRASPDPLDPSSSRRARSRRETEINFIDTKSTQNERIQRTQR